MATGTRALASLLLINALVGFQMSAQSTAARQESAPKRVRVNQGVLKPIHKVEPAYPNSVRVTAANNTVTLRVVIATDGSIKDVQRITGSDQLTASAISAVKQWKYKPLSVNGSPVEVETQVDVKFFPN